MRQYREQGDGQDQVAREAAEEALQRRVEMRRPTEHPDHKLVGFAREPQPDEQNDDRAERAQRVGDDQRQHRLHVDHQFPGFFFQHPCLVARPRPQP